MHLAIENVLKSLVLLWMDNFKGIDDGHEYYILPPTVWEAIEAIGRACTESGSTIPASFGARIPNIHTECYSFTAESWLLFATLIGPSVLRNRFAHRKYYDHFIELIVLFNRCLQLSFTEEDIDGIWFGFARWAEDFERIYYQFNLNRLPVCTLPIHALLHLADNITQMGPVWCYWAFPMERFCGSLLPAVKSRKHPYICLNHRVRDIAQLNQIKLLYNLTDQLDLSEQRASMATGIVPNNYPELQLVPPSREVQDLEPSIQRKIAAYLTTNYPISRQAAGQLYAHMSWTVRQWGKVYIRARTAVIHAIDICSHNDSHRRDASFVKYIIAVDKNARHVRQEAMMEDQVFYGQLRRVLEIELFPPFPVPEGCTSLRLVLALISPTRLVAQNKVAQPYFKKLGPSVIIDANAIEDVVGRVKLDSQQWALIQRTGVSEFFDGAPETGSGDVG
ncbi:hypothetical protein BC834DRAFT_952266 [Gloeopeniophorella convolvens]|nr:hypothetical protein BC834DRAFT_952266 [Gloeopeniophorella convolvens]